MPVFNNKTYLLEISAQRAKNEAIAYRYGTGKQNMAQNPAKATSRLVYDFYAFGYGLKKQIGLGRWGMLVPGISFHTYSETYSTYASYEIRDKNTARVVESRDGYGRENGGSASSMRTGVLMLFDNPKIGIDYRLKLVNHIYLNFSYSYWLVNGMANNLYGLSKRYIILFEGYNTRSPEFIAQQKDMYSHNISLGLTFSLRK